MLLGLLNSKCRYGMFMLTLSDALGRVLRAGDIPLWKCRHGLGGLPDAAVAPPAAAAAAIGGVPCCSAPLRCLQGLSESAAGSGSCSLSPAAAASTGMGLAEGSSGTVANPSAAGA